MTNNALRLAAPFSFYDETGRHHVYLPGQEIYAPEEIDDLTSRGAPVGPVDGTDGHREPQTCMVAHGRPILVLEGDLAEAIGALVAARGQHLAATTYLGSPLQPIASDEALGGFIDGFAAKATAAVQAAVSSVQQGIAARAGK